MRVCVVVPGLRRSYTPAMVALGSAYTWEQLADRVYEVIGQRPARATVRAGVAYAQQGIPRTRRGLLAGMPAPEPAVSRTAPSRFDAQKVEAWLAEHPVLQERAAAQALRRALVKPGADVDAAVGQARRDALSWARITAVLNDVGDARTRQAVFAAYRHFEGPRSRDGAAFAVRLGERGGSEDQGQGGAGDDGGAESDVGRSPGLPTGQ